MTDIRSFRFFAGNDWHEPATGKYFDSENPATGAVWARVPDCGAEDVNRAVAAAKAAFDGGPWGRMLPAERGRILRLMGDVISRQSERLGAVELRDNGRLPNIAPGLKPGGWQVDSFHYYGGMCDKFEGA